MLGAREIMQYMFKLARWTNVALVKDKKRYVNVINERQDTQRAEKVDMEQL